MKEITMSNENNTSQAFAATPTPLSGLDTAKALAGSLNFTASYLDSCVEKHKISGSEARIYVTGRQTCERLASEIAELSETAPGFVRYRNALYGLDEAQLEAFRRIKIDYQARIGGYFKPTTATRFFADLTMLIFALEAIDSPDCMLGVGTGFAPRFKKSGETA
ncbi:hypothetical protein [uncultured Agrobacterium sp.]|uniref:hypothetical protein n=1 Tax=uncultured Agrobacterium sp. TaxID=157277 RepID=UPI0025F05F63|nr:hypothetical protein [uncultured Agrobacterium sp.]